MKTFKSPMSRMKARREQRGRDRSESDQQPLLQRRVQRVTPRAMNEATAGVIAGMKEVAHRSPRKKRREVPGASVMGWLC